MDEDSQDIVTVARFEREEEGYLAKGLLESHGIPCEVSFPAALNQLSRHNMIGQRRAAACQLLVREEDAEEAAQILRVTDARDIAEKGVVEQGGITRTIVPATCPECGHDGAVADTYENAPWFQAIAGLVIVSIIILGLIPNQTFQYPALLIALGVGMVYVKRNATEATHYTCINCGAEIPPDAVQDDEEST
jgi:predicted RNA-binding Zn-ribbon protein involved in translation (DUF1610 family)